MCIVSSVDRYNTRFWKYTSTSRGKNRGKPHTTVDFPEHIKIRNGIRTLFGWDVAWGRLGAIWLFTVTRYRGIISGKLQIASRHIIMLLRRFLQVRRGVTEPLASQRLYIMVYAYDTTYICYNNSLAFVSSALCFRHTCRQVWSDSGVKMARILYRCKSGFKFFFSFDVSMRLITFSTVNHK